MSFVWKLYKNSQGEWAEHQGLILTAWPTGSWSVHDTTFGLKPRSSDLIVRRENLNLETAKKESEQAAIEMTT